MHQLFIDFLEEHKAKSLASKSRAARKAAKVVKSAGEGEIRRESNNEEKNESQREPSRSPGNSPLLPLASPPVRKRKRRPKDDSTLSIGLPRKQLVARRRPVPVSNPALTHASTPDPVPAPTPDPTPTPMPNSTALPSSPVPDHRIVARAEPTPPLQSPPSGTLPPYYGDNKDNCAACGLGGHLICCETCPESYHPLCSDPPVHPKKLPEGEWNCAACLIKMGRVGVIDTTKVFGQVALAIALDIPRAFDLSPCVSTFARPAPVFTPRRARVEPEILPAQISKCVVCFRACAGMLYACCSKCNRAYHLNCLNPPATHISATVPWICPQHIDIKDVVLESKGIRFSQHQRSPDSIVVNFLNKINRVYQPNFEVRPLFSRDDSPKLNSEGLRLQNLNEVPVDLDVALYAPLNGISAEARDQIILMLRNIILGNSARYSLSPLLPNPRGCQQENGERPESLQSIPVADDCKAILRSTSTGEIFFMLRDVFIFGRTIEPDAVDVDLEVLQVPCQEILSKHAIIAVVGDTDSGYRKFEFLNRSHETIFVDGCEVTSDDETAALLHHRSVIEIASVRFLFEIPSING